MDVLVIGAGQAGLAMGYHLARQGRQFAILDAAPRVGQSWRDRWDSLALFTPAQYSGLPGLAFPAEADHYPNRDEVADYLALYAHTFALPVRLGERVLSLQTAVDAPGYRVETDRGSYYAQQVMVATGPFQSPFVPAMSRELPRDIVQLHSSEYRNPAQLPPGEVLVVGGGNSGVQIAAEVAASRRTHLSVGARLTRLPERMLGRSLFWWLENAGVMNVTGDTRLGRRASSRDLLIGASPRMIARSHGVRLRGRTIGVAGRSVLTADGAGARPASVVWATGFRPDFRWVEPPVLDERGQPVHRRGVTASPGLYFLGLSWLHTRGSGLLGWVGRDAEYLAERISAFASGSTPALAAAPAGLV